MARFSFSYFLLASASSMMIRGTSADSFDRNNGSWINARSAKVYSTVNPRAKLATPGVSITISPGDSFDFIPAAGYSVILAEDYSNHGDADENVKWAFDWVYDWAKSERAHVVRGSKNEISEWGAGKQLLESHEVPRPNESLPGKVLTVESAKMHIRGAEGICHRIEQEASVCHQPPALVNVIEVEVTIADSTNGGKASKLWVACHDDDHLEHKEKYIESCHVMNVGDVLFTKSSSKMTEKMTEKKHLISN